MSCINSVVCFGAINVDTSVFSRYNFSDVQGYGNCLLLCLDTSWLWMMELMHDLFGCLGFRFNFIWHLRYIFIFSTCLFSFLLPAILLLIGLYESAAFFCVVGSLRICLPPKSKNIANKETCINFLLLNHQLRVWSWFVVVFSQCSPI